MATEANLANLENDEATWLLDKAGRGGPTDRSHETWNVWFNELRSEWENMTADERAAEVRRIRTTRGADLVD